GNCIPVARRLLADFETPLSAYQKLRGQGESFLFESVEGGEHLGRYSFVGCSPRSVIRQTADRVEVLEQGRVVETYRVSPQPGRPDEKVVRDGLQVVEAVLSGFVPVPVPGMPRFTGGAVGFIGYEFIHDVEPVVPRPPKDELGTPTVYFIIADQVLVFDRVAQTLAVIVHAVVPPGGDPAVAYEDAVSEIDRLVALLEQPLQSRAVALEPQAPDAPFVSNDLALEQELLADPKERAEHVMLVDLARNDIGRVCDYGSVAVRDLMVIERYSHVMHIVSQVNGRLSSERSAFDLMRTTFPAGTLSGAPKIRAMQIISELEGTTRGPYGGCVGYFGFNGNADHCITIRTALVKDGVAYVQAGGGWVNDSDPEAEFDETVNKSKAMRKAISLAEHFPR
ncbi:MAG: anthranilate synthase component I, partial [Proteobacteria bacterium]|nr:anthranilate synthase component I [Pseudomonadota bacterium]